MRVRSPSPRGCAYSEHAFYSAGSASMHFTVRAARCAATGSRGKRHEQGGAHDVGWSALHTATGRLIRHISSSLPPITLPSNAHRRAYYPLMRSRGQLNSVLSEPGRCVRTCAIDRDRSSIPRLTSSSRAISIIGLMHKILRRTTTRYYRLIEIARAPSRLCSLPACAPCTPPWSLGEASSGEGCQADARVSLHRAHCLTGARRAGGAAGRKPRKAKARDTLCP